MAAARSSKGQWRSFLIDLVRRSNPGIDCQLTPRQAFAALSKKFGVDVSNDDRLWVKETLYEVLQIEAEKAAAQKKQTRRQTHRTHPTLSSSDSDDTTVSIAAIVAGETNSWRPYLRVFVGEPAFGLTPFNT